MSVKARLKQALNQRSVTGKVAYLGNPDQWLKDFFNGGNNSGGVSVNKNTVLALSAFYACLKIRSETFSTFPFQVFYRDANGVETLAQDHYLYNLIHAEPNPRQSSYFYRQTKMIHLDTCGNGYAWIDRDYRGRPTAFNIIKPEDITPFEHGGRIWYKIDGIKEPVNSDNILHIANFSYDGYTGIDPISAQSSNLSLSLGAQQYGDNWLANGAHAKGILTSDNTPPPGKRETATDNVLKEWGKRYVGVDKAGNTPVLWGGLKYQEIGATPAAAMLLETRSMTVAEICRVYRIPEEIINSNAKSTATKYEQLMLQLQQGMLPTVKMWEAEYNRKLIHSKDKGKVFIRANMDGLLRADTEAQAKILETLFKLQALSPDEARAFRGMGPRADGMGNQYGLPFASNIKTFEDPKADTKEEV